VSVKKGLGRGFESLIPTDLLDESFDPTASQDEQISDLRQIKIDQITADPDQPRHHFEQEALEELAASIREHGILQPIVVTPLGDGYQIVAGERRYRAAKLAGLDKIPTLVRTLSGQHKLELSLIENLQRRDLNIIETGTAYLKLQNQFNLSLSQIGERVGKKSVGAISNTMRLLKLPQSVKNALAEGKVNEGQVRPLIGLDDELIESLLPRIIKERWTARDAENYIGRIKQSGESTKAARPKSFVSLYDQETKQFAKRFTTNVVVHTNTKGAGQIVIKFKNDDDFRRIQSLLDS
jgi:ParB family transcriptional regulator, chromosome partitioning protein